MDLAAGTKIDRYTVLGRGGSGERSVVYQVRHDILGSVHALKVLTVSAPSLAERLVLEARVQAGLNHPNIVAVTDLVDVSGAPGLVMEWVDGPNLHVFLQQRRPTLPELDTLGRDLISGVAAAHAAGLVHRNLEPANVLVTTAGDRLVPKIRDFGLMKVLGAAGEGMQHTRTGTLIGAPSYMAPEQVRNAKDVGPAADVFSLGAILYEVVTGQPAFVGEDLYEIFTAVAEGRYRAPRELVPNLPERMETSIRAALRVDPAVRPVDGAALLALWTGQASVELPPLPPPPPPRSPVVKPTPKPVAKPEPAPVPTPAPAPVVEPGSSPRALALGLLVGGGGATLAGLVVVGMLAILGIGWALGSRSAADPGGVVAPVAAEPQAEPVPGVDAPPEAPATPSPVTTPGPAPATSAPVPVVRTLPADLDPETSTANGREDALRDRYRTDPGSTGILLAVLQHDPAPDVRIAAADVLARRLRDGVDRPGSQSALTWCARSGEPVAARTKCLRALGDNGDDRAGAVLAAQVGSSSRDVREAAIDGCRVWLERHPGSSDIAKKCTVPSKTIEDRLDEGIDLFKRIKD